MGMTRSESRAHVSKSAQSVASTRPGVTNRRAKKGHCSATRRSTLKSTSDQPRNPSLVWNRPRNARQKSLESWSIYTNATPLVNVNKLSPKIHEYKKMYTKLPTEYFCCRATNYYTERKPNRVHAEAGSQVRSRCRPRQTLCSTGMQCLRKSVDLGNSVRKA